MAAVKKRYKLRLNSLDKIEELLQELYNEADKNIVEIQNQMNKLSNSVALNDEIMDSKTKYAKAMNDFITNKDKAIGRKLDIAKLMTEIHKFNGDVRKMVDNEESVGNWEDLKDVVESTTNDSNDQETVETDSYSINKHS
mgnify:FL=1|jgi:hypothetical protein